MHQSSASIVLVVFLIFFGVIGYFIYLFARLIRAKTRQIEAATQQKADTKAADAPWKRG